MLDHSEYCGVGCGSVVIVFSNLSSNSVVTSNSAVEAVYTVNRSDFNTIHLNN